MVCAAHVQRGKAIYIAIDHAERLRDMPVTLLPAMLRLHELVTAITVSTTHLITLSLCKG